MNPQDPSQVGLPPRLPVEPVSGNPPMPAVGSQDNDAAAAFARAKISAIFNQANPAPTPPSHVAPEPLPVTPAATPPPTPTPIYPEVGQSPTVTTLPQHHYQAEAPPPPTALAEVAPTPATPPSLHTNSTGHNTTFESFHLPGQTGTPSQSTTQAPPVSDPVPVASVIAPPPPMAAPPPQISRQERIKQFTSSGSGMLEKARSKGHILRPVIKFGLITAVVFLIYNAPIVLGQVHYYITPAGSEPTPIIYDDQSGGAVNTTPKIIISKLNIDVPVVYDETSFDEHAIQTALQRGIVHYGTTAVPGQLGNAVFLGHSSNSPWAPGRFKTAFSLLRRLEVKDTFVLHYKGQRYIYEVYDKHIISPKDFSVIDQVVKQPTVTLITCDPPGVNWRRLAIQAHQISPDPAKARAPSGGSSALPDSGTLPGSPPSLFDRVRDWIF